MNYINEFSLFDEMMLVREGLTTGLYVFFNTNNGEFLL